MSMSAVLAYRPDGSRARVLFQTRAGAYETESLIAFVRQLRRHFRGQPVILIWDGLPSHRSTEMKRFLAAQQSWLEVVRLPGYAPDLNPVEGLWAYLKGSHLANLNTRYIEEMEIAAEDAIDAVRARRDLLFAFLRHTGLSLCPSVS
jgi:putative transposase